jgi:hypothetical protein
LQLVFLTPLSLLNSRAFHGGGCRRGERKWGGGTGGLWPVGVDFERRCWCARPVHKN